MRSYDSVEDWLSLSFYDHRCQVELMELALLAYSFVSLSVCHCASMGTPEAYNFVPELLLIFECVLT